MLVLTCVEGRAAKRITPEGQEDYACGYLFTGGEAPVDSFASLVLVLEALRSVPSAFVIRGALRPGADPSVAFRRKYRGEGAAIIPCARQWLMVDADATGIPCPPEDPESAILDLLARMPPGLDRGPVYWHLSAGCRPDSLRAHLWFWLDRPYADDHAKKILRAFDTSIYQPVQPHYTADAIRDGVPDPYGRRSGTIVREGIASLGPDETAQNAADARAALVRAVSEVSAAPQSKRHKVLNAHAYRLGQLSAYLDAAEVAEALRQAAIVAGLPPERAEDETRRAIADGAAVPQDDWRNALARTDHGQIKPTEVNVARILQHDPQFDAAIRWDEFRGLAVWHAPPTSDVMLARAGDELADEHIVGVQAWLYDRHRITVAQEPVLRGLYAAAHANAYHPVRDWLDALEWDGTERISDWLHAYLGADQSDYVSAVGRKTLIAAVARVYRPGCQVDTIAILEGGQGAKKTSALRALAGGFYGQLKGDVREKDTLLGLRGAWLVEMAELDALSRSALGAFKDFATTLVDRYREPYGKTVRAFPRQCIFIGSTNEAEYLIDTENRRFLPVQVRGTRGRTDGEPGLQVDVAGIERDRDQLWAEAVRAFHAGEDWYAIPGARGAQRQRQAADPWIEILGHSLAGTQRITAREILAIKLGIPADRVNHGHNIRLGRVMHALGWSATRGPAGREYAAPAVVRGIEREVG